MLCLLSLALALTTEEKQAIQPTWTSKDSADETEYIQDSYKSLDHVQNELIDAAKRELEETKHLPTVAEATHVWHMGDVPDDVKKTSLAETKEIVKRVAPELADKIGDVDFSKLDSFRQKLDGIHAAMNTDIKKLKAQTLSDEKFAEEAAAAAKNAKVERLPPQLSALAEQREESNAEVFERAKKALVAHELAKHRHAWNTNPADLRLMKAQLNLEKLEQVMEAKHREMGDEETPESKFARQKIEQLLALSRKARTVMDAADAGGAQGTKAHLEQIERVKEQIQALKGSVKGHLLDHLGMMHDAVHDHVSFVQQQTQDEPGNIGYGKIAQNLNSLQDRIQGQIAALKDSAAKENEARVDSLNTDDTTAIAVDPLGNMRIDK